MLKAKSKTGCRRYRFTGICIVKRWPARSPIVCITALLKESNMLINLGRLLMVGGCAFLILNLIHPFPRTLNIFVNVALLFTALRHALQMVMLKTALPKDGPQMTTLEQWRVFLFGVFELLVWQKRLKAMQNKK